MPKPLTMIDLFAGCGGMTSGFVRHGFMPVFAVESNLCAAATYAANFGEEHIHWGDINDALERGVPAADIVIATTLPRLFEPWLQGCRRPAKQALEELPTAR